MNDKIETDYEIKTLAEWQYDVEAPSYMSDLRSLAQAIIELQTIHNEELK